MKNRLREDLNESLDPLEEEVLFLIDRDIEKNPSSVVAVPVELWDKIEKLTEGVEVDLDKPFTDGNTDVQTDAMLQLIQTSSNGNVKSARDLLSERRKKQNIGH